MRSIIDIHITLIWWAYCWT